MEDELDLFYEEFMQELISSAGSSGNFLEPTFTEQMCELLEEDGFFSDYYLVNYRKKDIGLKVDAWNYDFDTGILNLIVTTFSDNDVVETLNNSELEKCFKRVEKFFEKSLKVSFSEELD